MEFTLLAAAPDPALEEMDEIFAEMANNAAWPMQVLVAYLTLLGKKQGGTRTIATMSTWCRLFLAAVCLPLRDWDAATALPGDTAAPGKNPALEVARRAARAEIEIAKGNIWVQLMWDIQAFYDSIRIPEAIERLEAKNAPQIPTVMALLAHKAPRWLKMSGSFAEPVTKTGVSILAGCTSSTSLARAYMWPIANATSGEAGTVTNQHVDDLSHGISAATAKEAIVKAKRVATKVAAEIKRAKLSIADKRGGAEVLASIAGVAAQIEQSLRSIGLPFRQTLKADDLGIATRAGRRRDKQTTGKRI